MDLLAELVERIIAFMRRRPLAEMPAAKWTGTANDPIYAPEHLLEKRLFTSVITLTYRVMGQ